MKGKKKEDVFYGPVRDSAKILYEDMQEVRNLSFLPRQEAEERRKQHLDKFNSIQADLLRGVAVMELAHSQNVTAMVGNMTRPLDLVLRLFLQGAAM